MQERDLSSSAQVDSSPPAGQPPESTSWLNRNVVGMGLTSLLSDLCYETVTAVLPALLKVLGAPQYALGLIEGLSDALSSFSKLVSGWFSDRLARRKPLVVLGYAVTGVSGGLIALATVWPLILLVRSLAWIGKGLRNPPRNALLAESVPQQHRGKAFGFHRAGDSVGAILGPLAAAALIGAAPATQHADAVRTVLLLTLLPGLASVAVIAWMVQEREHLRAQPRKFWTSVAALPSEYRRYLAAVAVFGAGDFSHTLLIMAAIELLSESHGFVQAAQWGAVLFSLRNVAAALAAFPVGALSDRAGRRGLLAAGYLLGAAVSAGFGLTFASGSTSLLLLGLLFVAGGVVHATQESLEPATTADLVDEPTLRGTAYGVLGAVNGVGDFISSLLVGLLWTTSPIFGFSYAAAMMLAGALLLVFLPLRTRESSSA